jgi:hypothetical protein
LWRLAAASTGVMVGLALNVGPAAASSSAPHRPERNPVQVASQKAYTEQKAHSSAKSVQFLPINANVPVQILSLGKNGGDTTQSNNSTAKSAAGNFAWTGQSLAQHQTVKPERWKPEGPKGPHKPEGPKGPHKPEGPKGPDCTWPEGPKGPHGPEGPKGPHQPEGPKGPYGHGPAPAFQGASQKAYTDQDADSHAKSEQFLPVNANVPVQILSLGKNGGKTEQSNNSTAKSIAGNAAFTGQSLGQHQTVKGDQPQGPAPKGYGEWKPEGPKGPQGGGAFQGASQQASTDQNADSSAKSVQVAPINVNAPVQILSLGKNGGDTTQSNNSTAKSAAVNAAATDQSARQYQQAGPAPAPAFQGAAQKASTEQAADSSAKSVQVLPINANVPVQVLSLGHNGGDTTQSNNSTATSAAGNVAGTQQSLGQAQGLGGLIG